MAIKRKINKEEFEKLPDIMKSEYEDKGGSYIAIIDGDDEAVESLKKAKEHESNAHKETKKALKELEDRLNSMDYEGKKKSNDIEAIEKSWSEKLLNREKELGDERDNLKSMLASSLRDSTIASIASKIVKPDAQRLFKKSIEERFNVDIENGKASLRILDKEGKPSAMTLEDFEKEILADKEYGSILVVSKASGGAGAKPGQSVTSPGSEKPKPFSRMTPAELKAQIDAKGDNQ